MTRLLLVCLGGAAGSGARYLVSLLFASRAPGFPWATLTVNVAGSLLLATIMHVGLTTTAISPNLRLALATGVMGGFTTYSTFNYETMQLMNDGAWLLAATNVALTVLACLAAGFAGAAIGRVLVG